MKSQYLYPQFPPWHLSFVPWKNLGSKITGGAVLFLKRSLQRFFQDKSLNKSSRCFLTPQYIFRIASVHSHVRRCRFGPLHVLTACWREKTWQNQIRKNQHVLIEKSFDLLKTDEFYDFVVKLFFFSKIVLKFIGKIISLSFFLHQLIHFFLCIEVLSFDYNRYNQTFNCRLQDNCIL